MDGLFTTESRPYPRSKFLDVLEKSLRRGPRSWKERNVTLDGNKCGDVAEAY